MNIDINKLENRSKPLLWLAVIAWAVSVGYFNIARELTGGECLWALAGKHHVVDGFQITKGGTVQSWSVNPPQFYPSHPPLQGWYLALWYWLLGWSHVTTRLAMLTIWYAACFGVGWLALEHTKSLSAGLIASLFFLSFPATWTWGTTDDLTNLNASLMILGYVTYVFWEKSPAQMWRYLLMLVVFSLAALADWPGFVCLPVLFLVAFFFRHPRIIVIKLFIGAMWIILFFCSVFYYLSLFGHGPADLLGSLLQKSGTGGESLLSIPLYWIARGFIYLLPTGTVLLLLGIVRSLKRLWRQGIDSLSFPEIAMISFAVANVGVFIFLKEWTSVIAQTILYWVPLASFWSALVFHRWISDEPSSGRKRGWRVPLVLSTQVLLAILVIIGLTAKQRLVASDAEVGAWLKGQLRDETPLSIYVDHHAGDTNPVSFRYWTRREVHAVVKTELESTQDPYLFLPPRLAQRYESQGGFEMIGKYARPTESKTNFGEVLIKLYSRVFPKRQKFLTPHSQYEGWSLLRRAKMEDK